MLLPLLLNLGAAGVAPPAVAAPAASGGYFDFLDAYAAHHRSARKRKREADEARRIADAIDREIAQLLIADASAAEEAAEIERLTRLSARYVARQEADAYSQRVIKALERVQAQESADSLAALARAFRAQAEEEEFAVLFALAMDD